MRLLHFDVHGTLTSTNFSEGSIPPYTILSHRWDKDEVTFAEFKANKRWQEKRGARKINFCASATIRDGLQYFWIDTCCIDKWDTHELAKSINSMFQWYRNAQKCYVFLPDVSAPTQNHVAQRSNWEVSFRNSEWFTRGWTLQELIAPRVVEFFSLEELYLGDRTFLEQIIHETTGIPLQALRGDCLDSFSVEERRLWADKRTTQEPEDGAYCLLGLLNVQMSPSYGEGAELAFKRLQLELDASNAATFVVPLPQNPNFVGRESQLAELEKAVFKDEVGTRLAIVGPGGIGKSQVALEFAYRCRKNHIDWTILWINAGNIDSLYQSYATICQKVNVPGWQDEKSDILRVFRHYFSQPEAGKWLMVYDNADSLSLKSTGVATPLYSELVKLLPQSATGCTVFISTESTVANSLAATHVIELPVMTNVSAQEMFEAYAERSVRSDERKDVQLLLKQLSYHPLALVQAAAYIKIHQMAFHEYRASLVTSNMNSFTLDHVSQGQQMYNGAGIDPVLATLLLSLRQIQDDSPATIAIMFVAACVDPTDIPAELFTSSSSTEVKQQLEMLAKYKLINRRPSDSSLDLHRIVHAGIRWLIRDPDDRSYWHLEAATRLVPLFSEGVHRSKWRRLLPHASFVLSFGVTEGKEDNKQWLLMWRCALALNEDGRYSEAEPLQVQLMKTFAKRSATSLNTVLCMSNLAATYTKLERLEEAEALQAQVLEISKTTQGSDDPFTLNSMLNLASIYSHQHRWQDAAELEEQVTKIYQTIRPADDPRVLLSMNNLAVTYNSQKRWQDAEELLLQTVERMNTKFGADHSVTLKAMDNLATTYEGQGRAKDAEELYKNVMETRKANLGADHDDTLASIKHLSFLYIRQGREEDAKELYLQVRGAHEAKLRQHRSDKERNH